MERISHWVGGKSVRRASRGRTGPVFNPATGEQTHEVDFASVEEVDARGRGRAGGVPRLALEPRSSKRADILFRIHEIVDEHRRDDRGV